MTMKQILTITLTFITTWIFGQSDFSRITESTDSTYGYTDTNPLKMKKGNHGRSIGYSYDFMNGLRTHDNQKLKFLQRSSVDNPKNRKPKVASAERQLDTALTDTEQLDKYIFLTSEKKDTVTIYVDLHHRGSLKFPVGLKHK